MKLVKNTRKKKAAKRKIRKEGAKCARLSNKDPFKGSNPALGETEKVPR